MAEKSEAFISLVGGMNGGLAGTLLPENQYAFGLNVSSRGGLIHTRPAFRLLDVAFGGNVGASFQGSSPYRLPWADRVVCVISGRVLGIKTDTLEVIDYSAQTDVGLLDATVPRCWFCHAHKYMIVQDGVSVPIIIDGDVARRANQSVTDETQAEGWECPTGTIMAYGHGRLFIVPKTLNSQDGRSFFLAGDILLPNDPGSVLKFTETDYLSGGGAFSLPAEMGFITSMIFIRNAASGDGLGALVVFAQRGVSAFAVNATRATWAEIDISRVLFQGAGTLSWNSVVTVNNDIYFRAMDGIRSIAYTVSEAQQGQAGLKNASVSREVAQILHRDSLSVLPYVEMAVVDNRLFCTTVPADDGAIAFKSLIVLDADPISSIADRAPAPIYDGVWTGLTFLSLCVARHHEHERDALYIFAKNAEGAIELHMLEDDGYVATASDAIQCRLYTRAYNFGDIVNQKQFLYADFDLAGLLGNVAYRAYYRPFGYPFWAQMQNDFRIRANPEGYAQRRQGLRFTPKSDPADPVNLTSLGFGHDFDFCLEWEGFATVNHAVFTAAVNADVPRIACGAEISNVALAPEYGIRDLDPFGQWTDPYDPFVPGGDPPPPFEPGEENPDNESCLVARIIGAGSLRPTSNPLRIEAGTSGDTYYIYDPETEAKWEAIPDTGGAFLYWHIAPADGSSSPVVKYDNPLSFMVPYPGVQILTAYMTGASDPEEPVDPPVIPGTENPVIPGTGDWNENDNPVTPPDETAPFLSMVLRWKEGSNGVMAGDANNPTVEQIAQMKVLSTIANPSLFWTINPETSAVVVTTRQAKRNSYDCLSDNPAVPAEWRGLPLYYTVIEIGVKGRNLNQAAGNFSYTLDGFAASRNAGKTNATEDQVSMKLAGSLEIWPIAHTYGFDVVCADSVTRGEEFDFSVVCMDRTTNRVFGEYAPESPCLIVTDDPLDTFSEPAILPEVWDAGLASLAGTIAGGAGANQIVITVTDPETGYTGSKTVNVVASSLSLHLGAPAHVQRGEAFDLVIQGWNETTGAANTSYVPASTITITKSDGIDNIPDGAILVDNTGWVNGSKTVSVTLSGGSGESATATLHAQDDSITCEGFFTLDVNTHRLGVVTFSGSLRLNISGEDVVWSGGTFTLPWVSTRRWTLTVEATGIYVKAINLYENLNGTFSATVGLSRTNETAWAHSIWNSSSFWGSYSHGAEDVLGDAEDLVSSVRVY
jgi:hypothetical protein